MSPFELTLEQISIALNKRLKPNVKKISVQGCNKPGNTQIVFTIFTNHGYDLKFSDVKNIRFFRPDGDATVEKENMDKFIETFVNILNMYIT